RRKLASSEAGERTNDAPGRQRASQASSAARRASACIIKNSTRAKNFASRPVMPYRFAALTVALLVVPAAAAPAWAQAPVEAGVPTTIDAERVEGVGDFEVSAQGSAEIRQGERAIFGESLRLNSELGRLEGEGGVRLQVGTDRFFGPRLRFETLGDTGAFEAPRFLLQGNLEARGGGDTLEFLGPNRYRIENATFTT